ncbi:DNA repair protein RadC [Parasphingorhabdus sp.]|uniref:RadC family protein n=1 Tax=Parasphingorhabdus sp. TaxID=2709688 RepID=UPI0032652815
MFSSDSNDSHQSEDSNTNRGYLRKLLAENNGDALSDQQLVEYVLALVTPRRNTAPLARRLLAEFGSFAALANADSALLQKMSGMGRSSVAVLKFARIAAVRLLADPLVNEPVLSSWQALLDYLRADMVHLTVERVRILHLNSKNRLIRDEIMSEGSIDEVAIYPREVIKRALALGSTAIILVHNHPSGDPSPSRQDIATTRDIIDVGSKLGLSVHDHIIIGRDGHISLRTKGLI